MKKVLIVAAILALLVIAFAITSGKNKDMSGLDTTKTMHPSWDLDQDGMNDCEKDGTCDDSIDYSQPKPEVTVVPENCKVWFDGCNTCKITEPGGPMACTMMFCEHLEEAKCLEFNN